MRCAVQALPFGVPPTPQEPTTLSRSACACAVRSVGACGSR